VVCKPCVYLLNLSLVCAITCSVSSTFVCANLLQTCVFSSCSYSVLVNVIVVLTSAPCDVFYPCLTNLLLAHPHIC